MKALQLRSPLHLHYSDSNLDAVNLRLFINQDLTAFNINNDADYELTSNAINNTLTFEVAELIRSKNQYYFQQDFYNNRDTATYVLAFAQLLDDNGDLIENQYQLLKVRDGYVTRLESTQLISNLISPKFSDWSPINLVISAPQVGLYNIPNVYNLTNKTGNGSVTFNVSATGIHTFSVLIKGNNVDNVVLTIQNDDAQVQFNGTNVNVPVPNEVISYNVTEVDDYLMYSVVPNFETITSVKIFFNDVAGDLDVLALNPVLVKGNWLHETPQDLLLQDNTTIRTVDRLTTKIMFDKLLTNGIYKYGITNVTFPNNKQSFVNDVLIGSTVSLTYTNLQGTIESLPIKGIEECEHKYVAQKLSFVNKYGVIQDFVFFKKRVDEVRTKSEKYKANVLQGGEVYPHVGQKQIFRKTSERSVTLNSGFYSESYNSVFEQILNSLFYWINDEPCVLTSSSWQEKTRLNDKLINYTFDFEYSNNEINNIR